ncbi:MAG: hypothetical protein ACFFDN_25115 [Candidatus Hodarchaeota archaeon]
MPRIKAGTEIDEDDLINGQVCFYPDKYPEWFEPISERIGLIVNNDCVQAIQNYHFTIEQCKLMEQAINGELFTKKDIINFHLWTLTNARKYCALSWEKIIEIWQDEKNSKN